MGAKKLYILDLTSVKERDDNEFDLLTTIESVADGMISSPMYGKGLELMMKLPHIIISSNYLLDYELLSMDRWKVYEIKKDDTLGEENEIFHNPEKRKEIFKKQDEKREKRI